MSGAQVDVLLIGVGGIGAPCAIALAEHGVRSIALVDEDAIEISNLHRQILFAETDVGGDKIATTKRALEERYPSIRIEGTRGRALPSTVEALATRARVIVDATDNFPSRFLLADACYLAGTPIVHAAAIRWSATVIATGAMGKPCYRCLFEDLPGGDAPDCSTAGVIGPVCGVSGAIAADRAIALLEGDTSVLGSITTYDGRSDRLRVVRVPARADCPLCGSCQIANLDPHRYVAAVCSAL
jgi:adenylyltransferase/sulfurtransferase